MDFWSSVKVCYSYGVLSSENLPNTLHIPKIVGDRIHKVNSINLCAFPSISCGRKTWFAPSDGDERGCEHVGQSEATKHKWKLR